MIKQASTHDLFAVADFGTKFYGECGLPGTFAATEFVRIWTTLMASEIGEIWFSEENGVMTGALGYIIGPDQNTGQKVLQEAFWYADPKCRDTNVGFLFRKVHERAKEHGCARILMAAVHGSPNCKRVEKFYTALGFKPLETYYYTEV